MSFFEGLRENPRRTAEGFRAAPEKKRNPHEFEEEKTLVIHRDTGLFRAV